MHNRIIRGGWVDSEAVDSLSCEGERFFLRLCLNADDYGRFDARLALLKSKLFPLRENLRSTDIAAWLAECEKTGLVRCYEVAGKRYLLIPKFNQRLRIKKARFPDPPTGLTGDGQMTDTFAPEVEVEGEEEREKEAEAESESTRTLPHIPSVNDVEEYGSIHGVPADYCRHYHAICSERHRWLVGKAGAERLIGWQSEMKRWWEKDRTTWKSNGKRAESKQISETIDVPTL